ncbi:MAG: DNA polymerase III subunit delta [Candidatus Zixiibacteriota bacterium]
MNLTVLWDDCLFVAMDISANPRAFEDFLRDIRTSNANGTYITGDETFLKEGIIEAALSRVDGPMSALNRSVHYGKSLKEPKPIIDELLQFPSMSPERVVVIRDFEDAPKSSKEIFADFDIPDTSFLVIETEKPNARTKYHKKIAKKLGRVKAETPRQYKMKPWVDYFATQFGLTLDNSAKSYIIDMAGQNLSMLRGEIEKVSLLLGSGIKLRKADIEKIISQSRARSIFEFTDALLRKDKKLLLKTLDELMQFGESEQVILFWIRMEYFQIAMVSSGNTKSIAPFLVKKIRPNARRFSQREIASAMKLIYRADVLIKSGKMNSLNSLYWLIGQLLQDW